MKPVYRFSQHCFSHQHISGPVLEIGSGRDRFNRKLFSRKYKVVTTNIYPQNVVDRISSVTCLPFKDKEFGCVISEHVLEHVDEPQRAIAEISRVLKPNGLLILISPFSWPLHDKPCDLWRFSEEGLRHLLARSFERVSCQAIGNPRKPSLLCVTGRKPARQAMPIHPRVSVIMPTYNRAHLIAQAIDSIRAQTFTDWELIIVSDGSTDNTKEVVSGYKDPRIRFFRKRQSGCASARNYGLQRARGQYIAYSDDDDAFQPYHLQALVNYLDRHPESEVAGGYLLQNDMKNKRGYRYPGFLTSLMHRRNILKDAGLFDKRFILHSDTEFIFRIADAFPLTMKKIIIATYNFHKDNLILKQRQRWHEFNDLMFEKRIKRLSREHRLSAEELLLVAYRLYTRRLFKCVLGIAKMINKTPGFKSNTMSKRYLTGLAYWLAGNDLYAARNLSVIVNYQKFTTAKLSAKLQRMQKYAGAIMKQINARGQGKDAFSKVLPYHSRAPLAKDLFLPLFDDEIVKTLKSLGGSRVGRFYHRIFYLPNQITKTRIL